MSKKVYVGMSGGVDSSVTAALLKEQGYAVTGVYMKNWSQDLPGFTCPWKEDYQDAKRVAVQLGIDFKMYDFETEYRHKVVDYMVAEYQAGRTPNPDIMCNQEVKFKLFLETALEDGADLIATGHYARVKDGQLFTGLDSNKDQSYFLYRVTENALKHSLMPIGELEKPEVRRIAKKLGLATAEKKDSQGICFVGKVGIKEFLLAELGPQPHGPIVDQAGKTIGEHDGALFYTIGQRHGLDVGGGLPYYVARKDMKTNTVYVTTNLDDANLWHKEVELENVHWINVEPEKGKQYQVRLRYRGPLVDCELRGNKLMLKDEQRGLAAGQSAVLYDGDRVLGGGIIG
ncbi:MAG: tRNA (5-methylaminomethyl-2-thiouridylate)-methyltransferase [Candidatus Saccharibacteria bacterium]|nr:tRNA (5-methylaminomethyl-2-thiouridylate)-methyltransferase [Candidatus Saccharibacteria bacterium]